MTIHEANKSATGGLPSWVVLHVPHDSTRIPAWTRPQFAVDDAGLAQELAVMTDHHTFALFAAGQSCACVRAEVSRLVVDVERFLDDRKEPMAAKGLGVVYRATSCGGVLRESLDVATRERLIAEFYSPHHARLEAAVGRALERHGRCVVIDCHSFPREPLPFEDASLPRPDICIGTDAFHTPPALRDAFVEYFRAEGWCVGVDAPFRGAMVPSSRYQRDARVSSVMVEVERSLYLDRQSTAMNAEFAGVAARIQRACSLAIRSFESSLHRSTRV